MRKKKNTNSEEKEPRFKPKMVKLSDGSEVMENYHGSHPRKRVYKDPIQDPEEGKKPKDEASKHKYPPPKNNPIFRKKWMRFIDGIVDRDNFKIGHLDSLEILCDLYVEYDTISKIIRTQGHTYESISKHGKTIRTRPEVAQLEKCTTNIRTYTRQLDLFPKKDHGHESGGDDEEWS